MQHMGCEPDRASYNIMVDAYGRAGLHSGNTEKKESALHIFLVSHSDSVRLMIQIFGICVHKFHSGFTNFQVTSFVFLCVITNV